MRATKIGSRTTRFPILNDHVQYTQEFKIQSEANWPLLRVLSQILPYDHTLSPSQDFEADMVLKKGVKDLLEEMVCNSCLLPAEHKAAASILRVLTKEEEGSKMKVNLDELLLPPTVSLLLEYLITNRGLLILPPTMRNISVQ